MSSDRPGFPYGRWAVACFLAISLPMLWLGHGDRSAYVLTFTSFPGGQATFGLFGGNYILGDAPIMAENELYVGQILMFNGSINDVTMYFTATRAMYAFLASLWAPLFGVIGSQILSNYLAWAVAAAVAWRFTLRLFSDRRAALLAVILVSGGLGFAIHIHDYSPHLVPFAVYFVCLLAIYESGVWERARPLRVHLALGCLLALACLTYTANLSLPLGYLAVAVWRNRWWHIGLAAAIALTSRIVYVGGLNIVLWYVTRQARWVPVDATESDYLNRSLAIWATTLQTPGAFAMRVLNGLAQFSLYEFPLVVALGLAGWLVLPRNWATWRFFLAFYCLPLLAGLAFLNYSTTRGYMVYGASLLIYAPLAGLLATGLRSPRSWARATTAVVAVLVIGGQLLWSTGYLWGYIVPAKMFFGFGYLEWIPTYITQWVPAPAFSLTGAEPTPRMFGGAASLADAGMFLVDTIPPPGPFVSTLAVLSRLVILGYAIVLAVVTTTSWRTRRAVVTAVVVGLVVVPVLSARLMPPAKPPIRSTFYSMLVPPATAMRYRVTVGDDFIQRLSAYRSSDVTVQFVTSGIHAPYDVSVDGGGDQVFVQSADGGMLHPSKVKLPELLDILERSHELGLRIKTRADGQGGHPIGTAVFGWQRNGLANRTVWNETTNVAWDTPMLPAFELRLINPDGRAVLIGF